MFDYLHASWQKIKTKLNKLLPCFLSVFLMFATAMPSYAFNSVDGGIIENSWQLTNSDNFFNLDIVDSSNVRHQYSSTLSEDKIAVGDYDFQFNNEQFKNDFNKLNLYNYNSRFAIEYAPDLYDYYLLVNFHFSTPPEQAVDYPFFMMFNDAGFLYGIYGDDDNSAIIHTDVKWFKSESADTVSYSVFMPFPEPLTNQDFTTIPIGISLVNEYSSLSSIPPNIMVEGQIYAVNKGTDIDMSGVIAILQSIDSNTSNTNTILTQEFTKLFNLLNSGNSQSYFVVNELKDNLNNFDTLMDFHNQFENEMFEGFLEYNDLVVNQMSSVQFTGGLLNCANWVTDKYMDFFNQSGDFKQYFIYPLLLGIALFFVGRGSVILGNLYRKPTESSTHTVSTGYTVKYTDGTKRTETYTTTRGKGGRLRK